MNDIACHACSGTSLDSIVEYGSYLLRCAHCGEGVVATSFIAFRERTETFQAYLDPGAGNAPSPAQQIAQGSLHAIHGQVGAIAATGQRVLLVPHPSPNDTSRQTP